jgi:NAD(P)-dependent dehydrogenase (short-subunit alcohol dehydrogenase family)
MMVCPGFTRTGIEASALGGDGLALRAPRTVYGRQADPDEVAEAIFRGASRRRRLLVLSPVGKLSYAVSRVWPSLYERMMVRRVGVAASSSDPEASKSD